MRVNNIDSASFNAVYVKSAKFSPNQTRLKDDAFKKLTENCKDRIGINSTIAKAYSAQCNFIIEPAMDDGIAVRLESCGGNFTDDKVYLVKKDSEFDEIPFLVNMKDTRNTRRGLIPSSVLLFSGGLLLLFDNFKNFGLGMFVGGLLGIAGTCFGTFDAKQKLQTKLYQEKKLENYDKVSE